jgi:hypothetical protein
MKGTIQTPAVPKIAMNLVEHLFWDAIISSEKRSNVDIVIGKQMEMKKQLDTVKRFIMQNPYANFYVEVLNVERNKTKPIVTINFQNYTDEIPNMMPIVYHILLDPTYTTIEAFKASPDGILITITI